MFDHELGERPVMSRARLEREVDLTDNISQGYHTPIDVTQMKH